MKRTGRIHRVAFLTVALLTIGAIPGIDGDRLLKLEIQGNLSRIESRLENQENPSATEGRSKRSDVE